jgi:hypothetical protein
VKILLGDFNAKFWREDTFKQPIGDESLYENIDHNRIRIVRVCISEHLIVKSTIFPLHKIFIVFTKAYDSVDK